MCEKRADLHYVDVVTRSLVALFLIVGSLACGGPDFSIGDTDVFVHEQAENVWPDLPEALVAMQETEAPTETWKTNLFVEPAWMKLSRPGHACEAQPLGPSHIRARVSGESVAESCLPHEFAHFWRYYEAGLDAGTAHDEEWRTHETTLRDAARTTWLHR